MSKKINEILNTGEKSSITKGAILHNKKPLHSKGSNLPILYSRLQNMQQRKHA